jgi:hypothetical protein
MAKTDSVGEVVLYQSTVRRDKGAANEGVEEH